MLPQACNPGHATSVQTNALIIPLDTLTCHICPPSRVVRLWRPFVGLLQTLWWLREATGGQASTGANDNAQLYCPHSPDTNKPALIDVDVVSGAMCSSNSAKWKMVCLEMYLVRPKPFINPIRLKPLINPVRPKPLINPVRSKPLINLVVPKPLIDTVRPKALINPHDCI